MQDWLIATLFFGLILYLGTISWNLYCHRTLAHGHYTLAPITQHVLRFFIWFIIGPTTGPNWQKFYVAMHRKHHRYSDTDRDPFSPHHFTLTQLIGWQKAQPKQPYHLTANEIELYASDINIPYDNLEKFVYRHKHLGKIILTIILWAIFGTPGLIYGTLNLFFAETYLIVQLVYLVHMWGKSSDVKDRSTNNFPQGMFMGGEEFHTTHHRHPQKLNLADKWYEFDATYCTAVVLSKLNLCRLNSPTHSF